MSTIVSLLMLMQVNSPTSGAGYERVEPGAYFARLCTKQPIQDIVGVRERGPRGVNVKGVETVSVLLASEPDLCRPLLPVVDGKPERWIQGMKWLRERAVEVTEYLRSGGRELVRLRRPSGEVETVKNEFRYKFPGGVNGTLVQMSYYELLGPRSEIAIFVKCDRKITVEQARSAFALVKRDFPRFASLGLAFGPDSWFAPSPAFPIGFAFHDKGVTETALSPKRWEVACSNIGRSLECYAVR